MACHRVDIIERLGWDTVDPLSGLLDGPRASGAFLLRAVLRPPWSVRIRDLAPLSVAVVARGAAWVAPDEGAPVPLGPGDVMVARGPAPYTVSDDPGTAPQVFIEPGQHCTDAAGNSLADVMALGTRAWGHAVDRAEDATVIVTGTYESCQAVGERVLRALPPLVVVRAEQAPGALVGVLCTEMEREAPGQDVVLDRLLDLVVIDTLRQWFASDPERAPAWYVATADPVVGPALQLLDAQPARPWTIASLAAEVGVSRAALARRFTQVLGEPVISYLTARRLDRAADLLRAPDRTVASVAREVGYGSPFALSTAFKRVRGVSPAHYRAQVAGAR
jgi:AraC-like DNA-binding protein